MAFRIVVVHAFVDLPQVEVVGLQSAERVLELSQRHSRIPPVRADLCHQENVLSPVGDRAAHAVARLDLFKQPEQEFCHDISYDCWSRRGPPAAKREDMTDLFRRCDLRGGGRDPDPPFAAATAVVRQASSVR
jgi:hypothetical protein